MNELLLNVKSEYDKLLQENIELKKEIFELKLNQPTKTATNVIPQEIIYKFGNGPIRYYENGKYYHGIGINDTPKWNVNNKFDKCFFCYNLDRALPHKHLDTYNPDIFCINCIYHDEFNKRRTKNKLYKCLGHIL
jgi:hypothetical protein